MQIKLKLKKEKIFNIVDYLKVITDSIENLEQDNKRKIFFKNAIFNSIVQMYKFQREQKTKITEKNDQIQQEIKEIQGKIAGANDLILIKNRLSFELNKFGEIGKDANLNQRIDVLKTNRITSVMGFMRSIKDTAVNLVSKPFDGADRDFIVGKSLIALMFLTFIVTIGFYFVSLNNWIILLGFFTFVSIFFLFMIINILGSNIVSNQFNMIGLNTNSKNMNEYEKFMSKLNKKEDEFLVNAAWVRALRVEMQKIDKIISERLKGLSVETLEKQIQEYQNLIKQNNQALNRTLDQMISAEDYLRIRREMDIIKIELEGTNENELSEWLLSNELNIEGFSGLDDKIKEIISQLTDFIRQNTNLNVTFIS